MTQAQFTLSAFGDEIAVNLYDQLRVLNELNIGYLELRGVWNKNVLELDDDEARKVRALCDQHGVRVSAIGSPIGKSPIGDPVADDLARLERIMRTGEIVGTRSVRVFSYYPAEGDDMDALVPVVAARLAALAARAAQDGYELLLENEKGIVGDTIARCAALLQSVGASNLRFAWDPANFVQVDKGHATDDGWPLLSEYVGHIHVKDARLADGSVHPAGQGDGQVPELLTRLKDAGYVGYLALEPHLAIAGHSSGFSGPDGMAHAVKTLRAVMVETGCVEVP